MGRSVQSRNPPPGLCSLKIWGGLSATTAFGKTVIGAYLIGQRKVNTLILVQSSALLEQWKASLEQFLDIHEVLPELPKKRGRKTHLFTLCYSQIYTHEIASCRRYPGYVYLCCEKRKIICEAIALIKQTGVTVHTHKDLQHRYAIIDESIVWYGSVDLLAFGKKDTDVLRFENSDIAGELLPVSGEANSEQLMIEDASF